MMFKLCLLQIFWIIAPIQTAFKDFIIENEKDLERFGLSDVDVIYDDVDLENWLLSEQIYEALGESCVNCGDENDGSNILSCLDEEYSNDIEIKLSGDELHGPLDKNMLKAVMRELFNDPRFQHIKHNFNKDNLLLSYNVEKDDKN